MDDEKTRKPKKHIVANTIREITAITFWVYVICKLFIFDIDTVLVGTFAPALSFWLHYKVFIFLLIVGALVMIVRLKTFLTWLFFIVFYPLWLICLKVPYIIIKRKNWYAGLAMINAITAFFVKFKYKLVTSSFFIATVAFIIILENKTLIIMSVSVLIAVLLWIYAVKIRAVFQPSSEFRIPSMLLTRFREFGTLKQNIFSLKEELRTLEIANMSEAQLVERNNALQFSVLYNRICLLVAKKVKEYRDSQLNVAYHAFGFIFLVLITIVAFGAINLAFYKTGMAHFIVDEAPSYFNFFYYSFNTMILSDTSEIVPVGHVAQILEMVERFSGFTLVVILVILLVSVKSEKSAKELNAVIKQLESDSVQMEVFIQGEYRIQTIGDAVAEIERVKGSLLKLINSITNHIG